VKIKTKIRLLVMSKVEREKRLDELNRGLGIDSEEIKEREWLKRKISWTRILELAQRWIPKPRALHPFPDARFAATHPR
jgi:hypothetical protein